MGLRRRISLYLVGILSILAVLTLVTLRWHGHQKADQLDEAEARDDFDRLTATFQLSTLGLKETLKSWANWTELYDYVVDRSTSRFLEEELGAVELAEAGVDFLTLLDLSGHVIGMTEVPGVGGDLPATEEMIRQSVYFSAYVRSSQGASGCGAIKARTQVAMVCFGPIFNSQGQGHARGYIALGQWVNEDTIRRVSQVTGLMFDIVDVPTQARKEPPPATAAAMTSNMFRKDAVQVIEHDSQRELELRSPLTGLLGQDIAEIHMRWPRRLRQMVDTSSDITEMVVLTLIVLSGALLMLLLDRVVVRRLNLLRVELASIVDSRRWAGEVSIRGGDELAALARYTHELVLIVRQQVQELEDLSQTDALTGLPNRRAFDERLEHILAQYARQKLSAALILMDVDHFKKYNDTYGHPAGDEALKVIARCLRSALRRELDLPARLGGEEFGVLLQGVSAEQACAAAQHIRLAMQELALTHVANPPLMVMTMSLGVAVVTPQDTATTLYQRADDALYQAKTQGRNRVHLA